VLTKRRHRLGIESLESRTMLAADLVSGTLTVVGTNANDNIQVQVATSGPHNGELQVDVNGQQSFFIVNQVTAIQILGLNGNDQITVDDNVSINTTIHGGKGNDTINGGGGGDTIYGGKGNDVIHGGTGSDTMHGDAGNDAIWGGDDVDFLYGDVGNDTVDGEAGDDTCRGGNGIDDVRGGDDNDEVYGDNGKDSVWGGDGDDYMEGGNGKDDCHGEAGDDQLKGGRGRDRLDGESGNNLLDPDEGDDDMSNGIEYDLDNEFRAILSGQNNVSGEAEYEAENENGVLKTKFKVKVEDLAPNSSFDIVIDGITVGQIGTNASGNAEIKFSSNPSGGEVPFSGNFPTLHDGSIILVSNVLQGTFAARHSIS
jgi:Ca2+-binding RTX toxin-like protein